MMAMLSIMVFITSVPRNDALTMPTVPGKKKRGHAAPPQLAKEAMVTHRKNARTVSTSEDTHDDDCAETPAECTKPADTAYASGGSAETPQFLRRRLAGHDGQKGIWTSFDKCQQAVEVPSVEDASDLGARSGGPHQLPRQRDGHNYDHGSNEYGTAYHHEEQHRQQPGHSRRWHEETEPQTYADMARQLPPGGTSPGSQEHIVVAQRASSLPTSSAMVNRARRRLRTKTPVYHRPPLEAPPAARPDGISSAPQRAREEADQHGRCHTVPGQPWTSRIAHLSDYKPAKCNVCSGITRTRCKACNRGLCYDCAKNRVRCTVIA